MFDANEIGVDWKGNLQSLGSVALARLSYATADGRIKDSTGAHRCFLAIEDTIADKTFGKLVWARRKLGADDQSIDCLVKRPPTPNQSKQEAVIQWLCNISLKAYGLGLHCPCVFDVFTMNKATWFSMEPVYSAPILVTYMTQRTHWGTPHRANGFSLFKILSQIAMCCFVLERTIGFNHRDLKPDNVLIKTDAVKQHRLSWQDGTEIIVATSPTAVLCDFGFSCLGPGKAPWIQSGDGILPPFDSCPKTGRDIFMLLVFLIWREDVRVSLLPAHLDFLKSSLQLTKERWAQMMNLNRDPAHWVYILITERGFQCPALDPWVWLQSCAETFPDVVSIRTQSGSNTSA